MKLLSNGKPSTIGNFLELCVSRFGENSKATALISRQLKQAGSADSILAQSEEVLMNQLEKYHNGEFELDGDKIPSSPKMKDVINQVREILEKNDLAGALFLYDGEYNRYNLFTKTQKSLIESHEDSLSFSFDPKDFEGNQKKKQEYLTYSVNLMHSFHDLSLALGISIQSFFESLDVDVDNDIVIEKAIRESSPP